MAKKRKKYNESTSSPFTEVALTRKIDWYWKKDEKVRRTMSFLEGEMLLKGRGGRQEEIG